MTIEQYNKASETISKINSLKVNLNNIREFDPTEDYRLTLQYGNKQVFVYDTDIKKRIFMEVEAYLTAKKNQTVDELSKI